MYANEELEILNGWVEVNSELIHELNNVTEKEETQYVQLNLRDGIDIHPKV